MKKFKKVIAAVLATAMIATFGVGYTAKKVDKVAEASVQVEKPLADPPSGW